eukprot:5243796-Amphidinium_carterae.2
MLPLTVKHASWQQTHLSARCLQRRRASHIYLPPGCGHAVDMLHAFLILSLRCAGRQVSMHRTRALGLPRRSCALELLAHAAPYTAGYAKGVAVAPYGVRNLHMMVDRIGWLLLGGVRVISISTGLMLTPKSNGILRCTCVKVWLTLALTSKVWKPALRRKLCITQAGWAESEVGKHLAQQSSHHGACKADAKPGHQTYKPHFKACRSEAKTQWGVSRSHS